MFRGLVWRKRRARRCRSCLLRLAIYIESDGWLGVKCFEALCAHCNQLQTPFPRELLGCDYRKQRAYKTKIKRFFMTLSWRLQFWSFCLRCSNALETVSRSYTNRSHFLRPSQQPVSMCLEEYSSLATMQRRAHFFFSVLKKKGFCFEKKRRQEHTLLLLVPLYALLSWFTTSIDKLINCITRSRALTNQWILLVTMHWLAVQRAPLLSPRDTRTITPTWLTVLVVKRNVVEGLYWSRPFDTEASTWVLETVDTAQMKFHYQWFTNWSALRRLNSLSPLNK